LSGAHKAQPALAFVQLAIARADVALDTTVLQNMPIAAWRADNKLIHPVPGLPVLKLGYGHLDMVIRWRPSKMQAGRQR
jgi:hypothetical protein